MCHEITDWQIVTQGLPVALGLKDSIMTKQR